MSAPVASIILCTHNRVAMLRDAVETILADPSTTPRELIVVDNASIDGTAAYLGGLAAEAAATPGAIAVRVVTEPRPGKSHALNTAVPLARGALLLFTDDDVYVEPGWADALVAGFADPAVGVVSGRIVPHWDQPRPAFLNGPHAVDVELLDHGTGDRPLTEGEIAYGANLALRASLVHVFDPPFDPSLGPRGERRFLAEESHLVRRLLESCSGVYCSGAVVQHRVNPERLSLEWLRASAFDHGIGFARYTRLLGREQPVPLAKRIVRAARVYRLALQQAAVNDAAERTGPETAEELSTYLAAGRLVESAFGRIPTLPDFAGSIVRRRGR